MSLARYQINSIDVNFQFPKSLEIFDTNSANTIWSKKDKEIKSFHLMPIRVNDDTSSQYKSEPFSSMKTQAS